MEGHWKFLGGGGEGILKVNILEAKYEAQMEFPEGMGRGGGGGTVHSIKRFNCSHSLKCEHGVLNSIPNTHFFHCTCIALVCKIN